MIVSVAAILALEIWFRLYKEPTEFITEFYGGVSRLLGAVAALLFICEFSFSKILKPLGNKSAKALLWILPPFAVAVNNFPWVSLISGDCKISADARSVLWYALSCLCVGLFEELAFRGCALMLFLKKRRTSKLGTFMAIFWSSVIFGAVHLVNVFISSPGAVILQIGYSSLIGALCSLVLLETGNIWICVILHAGYNFAGGLIPEFGTGVIWTLPEIIVTAAVGVCVAAYCVWRFFKMPLCRSDELFTE